LNQQSSQPSGCTVTILAQNRPDLLMARVGAVARSRRDRQQGGDSVASAALFAYQKENAAPFSEAALRLMRASYLEKLEAL
jgi:hypothetical protein